MILLIFWSLWDSWLCTVLKVCKWISVGVLIVQWNFLHRYGSSQIEWPHHVGCVAGNDIVCGFISEDESSWLAVRDSYGPWMVSCTVEAY